MTKGVRLMSDRSFVAVSAYIVVIVTASFTALYFDLLATTIWIAFMGGWGFGGMFHD